MNKDLPPPLEPAPAVGTIRVDTKMRKVQFVEDIAVVLMDGSETRQIMFKGPPKQVFIDEMEPVSVPFDGTIHEFVSKRTGKKRTFKFGAPLREIFLDGIPYCAQFDNSPNVIKTADGEVHVIRLEPPPPTVDIEKRPPDHILRALNLHPEKLADTDQDLRTLPPPLPVVEGSGTDNAMDVDMRLPPHAEGAKDVDLRKRGGGVDEGGGDASWNSPKQQAGKAGWTPQPRTQQQQQPEDGFQPRENKESGVSQHAPWPALVLSCLGGWGQPECWAALSQNVCTEIKLCCFFLRALTWWWFFWSAFLGVICRCHAQLGRGVMG